MHSSNARSSSDGEGTGKEKSTGPQNKRKQNAASESITKRGRKESQSSEAFARTEESFPTQQKVARASFAGNPSNTGVGIPTENKSVVDMICGEGMTFPEKLMDLLNSEVDKQSLWWLPDGKAFAIDTKRFKQTILAQKFQGSKFESFTRKLARWGFKRNAGPGVPAHTFVFEHPYFLKSRPELAKTITGGTKKKDAPTIEEDRPTLVAPAARASLPSSSSQHHHNLREESSMQLPQQHPNSRNQGTTLADILGRPQEQVVSSSGTNLEYSLRLQSDLDKQMLLQSMINHLNNSSGEQTRQQQQQQQQQQDNLRAVTLLAAEQERSRILNAAMNSVASRSSQVTQPGSLAGYGNTASSASAAPQQLMGSTPLSSLYEQLSSSAARPASLTLPSNATTPTALDPLLRLYLQQQETSRRQSQRFEEETLLQELIRREQQQREPRPPPR